MVLSSYSITCRTSNQTAYNSAIGIFERVGKGLTSYRLIASQENLRDGGRHFHDPPYYCHYKNYVNFKKINIKTSPSVQNIKTLIAQRRAFHEFVFSMWG